MVRRATDQGRVWADVGDQFVKTAMTYAHVQDPEARGIRSPAGLVKGAFHIDPGKGCGYCTRTVYQ